MKWLINFVLGSVVAAGLTGCINSVDFDPRGTHVTLQGTWTLQGQAPTAELCEAQSIDRIEVWIFQRRSSRDRDAFHPAELSFACTDGSFSSAPILEHGSFFYEWRAFTESGALVGAGLREELDVRTAEQAVLNTADFVQFDPRGTDSELSASWTIDGEVPDATRCTAAGIATVQVVLYDANDTSIPGVAVGSASCESGVFDSSPTPVLAFGGYHATYQALDLDGDVVQETDAVVLEVSAEKTVLPPGDFSAGPILAVTLQWDLDVSDSVNTTGNCTEAGVMTMSYMIDGPTAASEFVIPCTTAFNFAVEPGTYSLFVEGFQDADGSLKAWSGTCSDLVVPASGASANCFITRTN